MANLFSKLMNQKATHVGAIATSLLAVLPAVYLTPKAAAQTFDGRYEDAQNVTVDEVLDETTEYVGETVTLRSEADQTDSPAVFKLDDDDGLGLFGLDLDSDEILVFNTSGVPFELPEEDVDVQVTGIVRNLVQAEVEAELGFGLDPDYYLDYENQPVVFAQSIALAPSPGEVTDEPEELYGRAIAVEGEVDEIYGPTTFTLNDDDLFKGEDLLVINTVPELAVEEDEAVVAVGELRPFVVAEIERDYELEWDEELQRQLEVEYDQRPVLFIREVYPSTQ
jgi:hypothetical protein